MGLSSCLPEKKKKKKVSFLNLCISLPPPLLKYIYTVLCIFVFMKEKKKKKNSELILRLFSPTFFLIYSFPVFLFLKKDFSPIDLVSHRVSCLISRVHASCFMPHPPTSCATNAALPWAFSHLQCFFFSPYPFSLGIYFPLTPSPTCILCRTNIDSCIYVKPHANKKKSSLPNLRMLCLYSSLMPSPVSNRLCNPS